MQNDNSTSQNFTDGVDEQNSSAKRHLMQATTALIIILALVAVALFFLAVQWVKISKNVGVEQNTITVSGRGEIVAVPDIATISFSVHEEGKTTADAQEKATAKTNKVLAFLSTQDIDEKDVKTTGYNAYPEYEYFYANGDIRCYASYCPPPYVQKQNIIRYIVEQQIEVKVRDITKAGAVLAGIGEQNVSNLSGVAFTIDDEESLKEDARALAIADAREQAERLAKELNVRLGKIVSFNESGNYPMPMYYKAERDMAMGAVTMESQAPAPEVPAGENEIISNVTIVYQIK